MILDELLEFADATTITTATGTALCGDVIDLGAVPQDFGAGRPMWLVLSIGTAVTSAGSATVAFTLASDSVATIATNGSATEHYVSQAIGKATLVAGYQQVIPLPTGVGNAYERYLGVLTTVGTAALTAGTLNAFLTFDPKVWKSYADATN